MRCGFAASTHCVRERDAFAACQGFKSDYQRDGLLRVTKLLHEHLTADQAGGTYGPLGTWDYAYDSGGNESSALETPAGHYWLAADAHHTYDTADRLVTTRNKDQQGWGLWSGNGPTTWYNYDDLGNRISHQHRGTTPIGYAHDKANRMTTIATLTQGYDLAGNVTLAYSADRGTSYTYRWDHHP